MIRVGTTSTVYALSRTVQTGYPVESRPNTFYATNAAWQDHSARPPPKIIIRVFLSNSETTYLVYNLNV